MASLTFCSEGKIRSNKFKDGTLLIYDSLEQAKVVCISDIREKLRSEGFCGRDVVSGCDSGT
jgi:hypothetical protein